MSAMDELLRMAQTIDPDLYRRAMLERYLEKHGPHYDEQTAREAVSKLHSKSPNGEVVVGERWTYDEALDAVRPYMDKMDADATIWDAYVALNMWWHALRIQYGKRTADPEPWIIEDALAWAFMDGKDGLVWKYMHAVA